VVETRKTVLGLEHPDTVSEIPSPAAGMNNLESTYWNQGDGKAERVKVLETRTGPEHLDYPTCKICPILGNSGVGIMILWIC
jgi:hypothetical protein